LLITRGWESLTNPVFCAYDVAWPARLSARRRPDRRAVARPPEDPASVKRGNVEVSLAEMRLAGDDVVELPVDGPETARQLRVSDLSGPGPRAFRTWAAVLCGGMVLATMICS
jgi:hypothetical protein